jgi:hypothetical protein
MNKFIKTIPRNKLGYEFLHSLNGLLELTDRELELLAVFLDINLDRGKKPRQAIDSTEMRRLVMSATGITKDNLSRYIKMFKNKQIFIIEDSLLSINKALVPIIIAGKVVQITMILKVKEDEI